MSAERREARRRQLRVAAQLQPLAPRLAQRHERGGREAAGEAQRVQVAARTGGELSAATAGVRPWPQKPSCTTLSCSGRAASRPSAAARSSSPSWSHTGRISSLTPASGTMKSSSASLSSLLRSSSVPQEQAQLSHQQAAPLRTAGQRASLLRVQGELVAEVLWSMMRCVCGGRRAQVCVVGCAAAVLWGAAGEQAVAAEGGLEAAPRLRSVERRGWTTFFLRFSRVLIYEL